MSSGKSGIPSDAAQDKGKHIGGGRSGQVYLLEGGDGRIARKIFVGDRLGKLIHYLFSGAPNPYTWNADAIQSARVCRQLLADLIRQWMGDRVEVSNALGSSWNAEERVWQLDTVFLPGRPTRLIHPLRAETEETAVLIKEVMEPLQGRLREFGFDGLVWQAGKGNPVALNNFLLLEGEGDAKERFAFIDLESGVPALFPLNPLALLFFYLPKALWYGRPLFDDVDGRKLNRALTSWPEATPEMLRLADELEAHQRSWKNLPWRERSLCYQISQGGLTEEQAEHYRRHPVRWYWREGKRAAAKGWDLFARRIPRKLWEIIRGLRPIEFLQRGWLLARSVEARSDLARDYVSARLDIWRERGQLSADDHELLIKEFKRDEVSGYMGDFGAHLGLKASAQVIEAFVFSALFAAGLISGPVLALIILADGLIYRTSYTLYRCFQAGARLRPLPLVALGVGVFPLVGSLAYPAQMIWSAAGREDDLARFIVYDTITRIGTALPIWGGEDTRTEHFFNGLAHRLAGR